jgi:1-acyl-sn-glycerol-3-phosphate acyltransferase
MLSRLFKKDAFGNYLFIKKSIVSIIGALTYRRFNGINKLKISGTEHLENLPQQNVIFLSNHQTYYADVIAFYHIFCSVRYGLKNSVKTPLYLTKPVENAYFVAAEETMKKSGFLPRVFSYAGAVTVQRSWRSEGQNVQRNVDLSAVDNIGKALSCGWVVSFPQGTTSPYAPVRKGVTNIIRDNDPIIVPVVINGFRRAFDKKGLKLKKKGTELSVTFKQPFKMDLSLSNEQMIDRIREEIEQQDVMERFRNLKFK